jgi:hypothetical protein
MTGYPGLGFDPTPGDASRVAALAEAAASIGRHVGDAEAGVTRAVAASQPWEGQAADEFRRRGTALPARLAAHRGSAESAAEVLFGWASDLADLTLRAEQYERRARTLRADITASAETVDEWVTAVSVASTHTRPAAEATLADHQSELDGLRARLAEVLAAARRLATEHRQTADQVTERLRATSPATAAQSPTPQAAVTPTSGLGAVLSGLAGVTRRASALAALAGPRTGTAPEAGAGAALTVSQAPSAGGTRSWAFGGAAVPLDRLRAALPGGT